MKIRRKINHTYLKDKIFSNKSTFTIIYKQFIENSLRQICRSNSKIISIK